MTSQMIGTEFKKIVWWKSRTLLERCLLFLSLAAFAVIIALAVVIGVLKDKDSSSETCLTPECISAASTVLRYINTSVDPCDDFYEFACGNFLESTNIPDDKSGISQFSLVDDALEDQMKQIVQEPIQSNELKPFKMVKKLYQMCMNTTNIENTGLKTVKHFLHDLGGWPVLQGNSWNERDFDWKKTTYQLRHLGFSDDHFISFGIDLDDKNSTKRVLKIDQANLGLSRKLLIKGWDEKIVKGYYDYMVEISTQFGADRSRALKELKDVVELEMKLANISIPTEERRNATLEYNPMTIATLQQTYPSIPWLKSINMLLAPIERVDNDEIVIVLVPKYFKALEDLIRKTPKRTQANYILWSTVRETVFFLNEDIRKIQLKFSTVVNGRTERRKRWKECVEMASDLHIAAGSLYVRKYFSSDSKQNIVDMVADIRQEFKEILKSSEWMDEETKKSAFKKVEELNHHIGYPQELLDDAKIEEYYKNLDIDTTDYLRTHLNLTLFATENILKKFRQPVNKTDWRSRSLPAVVNAYYKPSENSIEFPAGILQGIFFNKDRPQYMNYGSIGFVIGHEITHGFDDEGRQFDGKGNLIDWWAPETQEAYNEKAQCIIDQYGNYTVPEVDMNLNGINTQGENIADNGGIKEAYLAYNRWVQRNGKEQTLPGLNYTSKQLFWISAATTWCSKSRPQSLKLQVLNGFHSPARYRIIGPFGNSEYFAKDFGCPVGSNMNPEHKCQVW